MDGFVSILISKRARNAVSNATEFPSFDRLARLPADIKLLIFEHLLKQQLELTDTSLRSSGNGTIATDPRGTHHHINIPTTRPTVLAKQPALIALARTSKFYCNEVIGFARRHPTSWPAPDVTLGSYLETFADAADVFNKLSSMSVTVRVDGEVVLSVPEWSGELQYRFVRSALRWRLRQGLVGDRRVGLAAFLLHSRGYILGQMTWADLLDKDILDDGSGGLVSLAG